MIDKRDREGNEASQIVNDELLESLVFEAAGDGILICDSDFRIVTANSSFHRICGYDLADVLHNTPFFLDSGYQHEELIKILQKMQNDGVEARPRWSGEMWLRRQDGEIFPAWMTVTTVSHGPDKPYVILLFSDMTGHKRKEQKFRYRANFDLLTDLPNRHLFYDRLSHSLRQAQRENFKVAVARISLDGFKKVNDTMGHEAGDELLCQVKDRLLQCLEGSDSLARFSGDHFALMFTHIKDSADVERRIKRLSRDLEKVYSLRGQQVSVTVSIGVSFYPDDAEKTAVLLSQADRAMYEVKSEGGAGCHFFTNEIEHQLKERNALETGLRNGLRQEQFFLHYQPIYDVQSREILGLEALLRWYDPDLGMVTPDVFIPVAEETGMIVEIGAWVLRRACEDIAALRLNCRRDLFVAVNVSAPQFYSNNFDQMVLNILAENGLPSDALELEVTERLLLGDRSEPEELMKRLHKAGVRLSIDDFGTGYSALSYLKRFPFDTLKIDRAFVQDVLNNQEDAALINAIIAMAHGLGLKVICEGVETAEQLDYLQARNADMVQGFYLMRPTVIQRIEEGLED